MLKILHIGKYYSPVKGGMETVLKLLAEGLRELDCEVTVLCSSHDLKAKEDKFQGVKIYRLAKIADLFGQSINPLLFFKMRKLAKSCDLIHIHSPNPIVEFCVLFLSSKIPLVMTHHSDVVRQKFLKQIYLPVVKLFLKRVKRIIIPTVNHLKYSDVLLPFEKKCSYACFGIKLKDYLPSEKTNAIKNNIIHEYGDFALFVGRLVEYKGVKVLIEAMKDVDAKVIIIGDGPLYSELKVQAIQSGVSEKVVFMGELLDDRELIAYYQACQFLVLPSVGRNENFGMVQLEAMICQKPVIATNLKTGVPCVGVADETTLLVKPGDPKALACAMNRLFQDKSLRMKMGQSAYERALTKYDWLKMAREYYDIYVDVLGKSTAK